MKQSKSRAHKARKAQTSLELLIVLTVVTLLSAIIISDFVDESSESLVLAAAKTSTIVIMGNEALKPDCLNTTLKTISITGTTIMLDVQGKASCYPSASDIADSIEKSVCSATPNNDFNVDCPLKQYQISVI